jgi:hypothetical protein
MQKEELNPEPSCFLFSCILLNISNAPLQVNERTLLGSCVHTEGGTYYKA